METRHAAAAGHGARRGFPGARRNRRDARSRCRVPEEFLRAQWTRLPGGETPPAFTQRVHQLLDGDGPAATPSRNGEIESSRRIEYAPRKPARLGRRTRRSRCWRFSGARRSGTTKSERIFQPPSFVPPPHSVAVLAFANMSGDREEEYFSDGLAEEILQSLAQVVELKVAARTSSFSFKGSEADIPAVGRKLNVGAVLEGSVRARRPRARDRATDKRGDRISYLVGKLGP